MINPRVKTILFVDDDEVNNFVLHTKLESHAPEVKTSFHDTASSAIEYLKAQIAEGNFLDLIFLDVKMPGMSGFDFLEEYHQRNWHDDLPTKIFMLSSSITEQDREDSLKYPAGMEFINKPLTLEHIDKLSDRYF